MDNRIEKYFSGELDNAERIQLMQELQVNGSLLEEFTDYKKTLSTLSFMDNPNDKANGQISYHNFIANKNRNRLKKLQLTIFKYSAAIAAIIVCTLFINNLFNNIPSEELIAYNTITVPAGQRVSVTLSDGTEVWLNSKSSLTYPTSFQSKNRNVSLVGEAIFDVTRNEEQPFIVSTSSLDIKVLGTTFNVNAYKEQEYTEVALLKGSIEVDIYDKSEKIKLQSKEKLNYQNDSINIEKIVSEDNYLWHKGIYNFENEPLEEITRRLQLYYDVKIEIRNPNLLAKEYRGKFKQQDGIAEILRIIQQIHKFKIKEVKESHLFIIE